MVPASYLLFAKDAGLVPAASHYNRLGLLPSYFSQTVKIGLDSEAVERLREETAGAVVGRPSYDS